MARVPVTVIRHPKERISKCSLRFLHDREEFTFLRAKPDLQFDATGFLLLAVDAPPLTAADQGHPILLLDSTWRYLPQVERCVTGEPVRRSIPGGVETAYPRVSRIFDDPEQGLASVEALYVCKAILEGPDPTLLDGYHWKDQFLASLPAELRPAGDEEPAGGQPS
jgi:pre-rRNA-processing protein TSR3